MREQLISFKTAKLLKEIGFATDSYTGFVFDKDGNELNLAFYDMSDKYARPTQSLVQNLLREKHNLYVIPYPQLDIWVIEIKELNGSEGNPSVTGYPDLEYSSYEEALEIGLQEALKMIEDGNTTL